jgi:hypothetical protein
MATPNLLLCQSCHKYFNEMVVQHSRSAQQSYHVCIPFSLRYIPSFPALNWERLVIGRVLAMRPFVIQVLPVLRVPEIISAGLCTSMSLLVVLYEDVIYVWVGVELGKAVWDEMIGAKCVSISTSFTIVDVHPDFSSDLWVSIRSIRQLYAPFEMPVIVIPSESGKRSELCMVLSHDEKGNCSVLRKRFAELARMCMDAN